MKKYTKRIITAKPPNQKVHTTHHNSWVQNAVENSDNKKYLSNDALSDFPPN